ncbi:hypothetical protein Sjap_022464 [Stephania japonica]|uniref:RING-type E3 ubiquitin transferase n=1 Tax=Stephania japonica TaxID=461633 RepID=A0AAP0ES20_9MAGN
MQGRRSILDSHLEPFEFHHSSSLNNTAVERHLFHNTVMNPLESQLPNYRLPVSETTFTFADSTRNEERRYSGWAFGESSSSQRSGNQIFFDEMETGHARSSLSGCGQNAVELANESSFCPHLYGPAVSETEQSLFAGGSINYSSASSCSTRNMNEEADDIPSCSLDNRRFSCKRKSFEGVAGPSSLGGTPGSVHQAESTIWQSPPPWYNAPNDLPMPSLTGNSSGVNPSEQLAMGLGSTNHSGIAGNFENSGRNFHMGGPSSLSPLGTHSRHSYSQPPHHSTSRAFQLSQSLDSRSTIAGSASSLPFRNMQPLQRNGGSNSRVGSSSSSSIIPGERMAFQTEINTRSTTENISDYVFFASEADRTLAHDPRHWSLANGHITSPANTAFDSRVAPSSMIPLSAAPTIISHHSPPQHPRSLSEVDGRHFFNTSGSDVGGQSYNFSPQLSDVSASSQRTVLSSGTGRRGRRERHQGSSLWMERPMEGVFGVPPSLRPLPEGRSRLVSEIRNALDFMRRGGGEGLRFEDVFFLDQSSFYAANDLHDRHRDMRLDVDNMTYEELLALEERIGNVSTGLSEETIMKFLKQRKYLSMPVEPRPELEPCCVCQEEYNDGDDLGVLDCGHDFHAPCIKQWLAHKNSCPICKTTALIT